MPSDAADEHSRITWLDPDDPGSLRPRGATDRTYPAPATDAEARKVAALAFAGLQTLRKDPSKLRGEPPDCGFPPGWCTKYLGPGEDGIGAPAEGEIHTTSYLKSDPKVASFTVNARKVPPCSAFGATQRKTPEPHLDYCVVEEGQWARWGVVCSQGTAGGNVTFYSPEYIQRGPSIPEEADRIEAMRTVPSPPRGGQR